MNECITWLMVDSCFRIYLRDNCIVDVLLLKKSVKHVCHGVKCNNIIWLVVDICVRMYSRDNCNVPECFLKKSIVQVYRE